MWLYQHSKTPVDSLIFFFARDMKRCGELLLLIVLQSAGSFSSFPCHSSLDSLVVSYPDKQISSVLALTLNNLLGVCSSINFSYIPLHLTLLENCELPDLSF